MTFKEMFKDLVKEKDLLELGVFSTIYCKNIYLDISNYSLLKFFPRNNEMKTKSKMHVYVSFTDNKLDSIIFLSTFEGDLYSSQKIIENVQEEYLTLKFYNLQEGSIQKPSFEIEKDGYTKLFCNTYCGVNLYFNDENKSLNCIYISHFNVITGIIFTTRGIDNYVK